jgi:hypothetical protein
MRTIKCDVCGNECSKDALKRGYSICDLTYYLISLFETPKGLDVCEDCYRWIDGNGDLQDDIKALIRKGVYNDETDTIQHANGTSDTRRGQDANAAGG